MSGGGPVPGKVAAGVVALVLLLAGCGSHDDPAAKIAKRLGCLSSYHAKKLTNFRVTGSGLCTVGGSQVLIFTFKDDIDRDGFALAPSSSGAQYRYALADHVAVTSDSRAVVDHAANLLGGGVR